MKPINNILVAVPASAEYRSVVQYAVKMAHDLSAKLTVAFVYEPLLVNSHEHPVHSATEIEQVKEGFEQLKQQILPNDPVEYRMVTLDGPLSEAILAAGPNYLPDLVITAADSSMPLSDVVQKVSYHLLLVPPSAEYHPLKQIALAYNASLLENIEPINFVGHLAEAYQATVEIVEFGSTKELDFPMTNRSNVELGFLLKDVTYRFHLTIGDGSVQDMAQYVDNYSPNVLVVLARRQLPMNAKPEERHSVGIARTATVPILVLKP
ncbi:MAG: universal stress protein [Bacteroidota bacterium]